MAAFILDSLVLAGSVRQDAVAVEARLGTSLANPQVSGNRNSLRHPLPSGCRLPEPQDVDMPFGDYSPSGATPGAGRSRCFDRLTYRPFTKAKRLSWRKPEGRTPPVSIRATVDC
jgi:hypothetical protein